MAKIAEQLAVIKISQLVKDSEDDALQVFTPELASQMAEVIEGLLDNCVVEIEVSE